VVAFTLVASAAALIVWQHDHGAKFVVFASPRPAPGYVQCVKKRMADGADYCPKAITLPWYHVAVRNVGGRGGSVRNCYITAHDARGRPIPGVSSVLVPLSISQHQGMDSFIDVGESATLDFFLNERPPSRIASYTGWCTLPPVDEGLPEGHPF
jgi:hypothetical protein